MTKHVIDPPIVRDDAGHRYVIVSYDDRPEVILRWGAVIVDPSGENCMARLHWSHPAVAGLTSPAKPKKGA